MSGTAGVTVTSAPPPPSEVAIELPRVGVNTAAVAVTGRRLSVGAGQDLQGALNAAVCGDEVVLASGAVFTGNFVLPQRSCGLGAPILVRSDVAGPGAGVRVTPAGAGGFAKLVTANAAPALRAASGARGWRLQWLEVTATAGTTLTYELLQLGGGSETTVGALPGELIVDRLYVHGHGTLEVRRCIALNSTTTAVINSYVAECHHRGADAQAVWGWNGPGPYRIANNYLEASGENVGFGGADPRIVGQNPADIEIVGNYIYKPLAWRGQWLVKNSFELKSGLRVLFQGNVVENNWVDGQNGYMVLLQAVNQDGNGSFVTIRDITIRQNIFRNSPGGVNLTFKGIGSAGVNVDQGTSRVRVEGNLFDRVGSDATLGSNGRLFLVVAGVPDAQFVHNTASAPTDAALLVVEATPARLIYRDNISTGPVWGQGTPEGNTTLSQYLGGGVFRGNLLVGRPAGAYSSWPGNQFPATLGAVGFVNASGGDYQLSASSPYRGQASDGRDPGLDAAALRSATSGVIP